MNSIAGVLQHGLSSRSKALEVDLLCIMLRVHLETCDRQHKDRLSLLATLGVCFAERGPGVTSMLLHKVSSKVNHRGYNALATS